MASSMIPIYLFLSAFHVLICRSELSNSDFFLFPLRTDEVPIVHNGDIVNVTWLSRYDTINLYLGCADGQMDAWREQPGNGNIVLTVNSSWTSPCHWQLVKNGDEKHYFDSGQVDVINFKATPAVTWVPSASGTPCGVQTISASGQSTGTSSPVAIATVTANSAATACGSNAPNDNNDHGMGTGASIGVGIVAGVAAGALVGVLTLLIRRRLHRKRQENAVVPTGGTYYPPAAEAYYAQQYNPYHYNYHKYNVPELHSEPVH